MRSSRVLRAASALAVLFAASTALALPSVASELASEPTTTRVSVLSSQVWTDTGVRVRAGELVEIHARGRIDFGPSRIDRMTPAGIARAGGCRGATSTEPWPAPTLACWALIGKVGSAPPFEIGASRALRVTSSGELFLGVNDNHVADNSGSWSADLSVTSVPAAAGSNDDSSTLKKTAIAVGGLVALIALFAVALLVARRRTAARRAAEAQPTEAELRELAAVVAGRVSGDILPEPRGHAPAPAVPAPAPIPTPTITAPKGDPTDVNIFEVEFPDFASLRVGYSYFPEGTGVRWLVRQGATTAATGEFVTSGGGGANHYVTIVLGTQLELRAEAADIHFTWEIGGVPFGYSVRRDPGA